MPSDCDFCFPVCSRTPGRLSSFLGHLPFLLWSPQEVFRLWCLLASSLCTEELLECLQAVVSSGEKTSWRSVAQLPCVQQISWNASGCGVSCLTALSADDLLGWLMIWYLQESRLPSSLPQQKRPGRRGIQQVGVWGVMGSESTGLPAAALGL